MSELLWEKKFRNSGKRARQEISTTWGSKFMGASSFGSEFAGSGGRATRDSVVDAFPKIQMQWEGYESNMYTDVLGLVTTGIGNLIDGNSIASPMASNTAYSLALQLPWIHKSDGQPATQAEIIQDWQTVKAAHTQSGTYDAPRDRQITQLKLSPTAIADLVASKMLDNEGILLASFPNFAQFPADAQMAIHGMAWAMGPAFVPKDGFTKFAAAANAQNWADAKAQSAFKGAAPQRKAGQDQMFDNAAKAVAAGLDFNTLWYPGIAPSTAPPRSSPGVSHIIAGMVLVAAAGGAYYYRDDLIPIVKNVARDTVKVTNRYLVDPTLSVFSSPKAKTDTKLPRPTQRKVST
jgi:hypothetical protein